MQLSIYNGVFGHAVSQSRRFATPSGAAAAQRKQWSCSGDIEAQRSKVSRKVVLGLYNMPMFAYLRHPLGSLGICYLDGSHPQSNKKVNYRQIDCPEICLHQRD